MKTGIVDTSYGAPYGNEKGINMMKAHGYDCVDYQHLVHTESAFFTQPEAELEKQLRAYAGMLRDGGMSVSQAHGPWRCPPDEDTKEKLGKRFLEMAKAVRGTAYLGAPLFVIHPVMPFGCDRDPEPERFFDINLEFMGRLADEAKPLGVDVCIENLPFPALGINSPEQVVRFVKALGRSNAKVCLDTGHAAVCGVAPSDAVRLIGKELLAALHVHDNDGRRDLHQLPYQGVIDWEAFSDALEEIGYEGVVSLECGVSGKIPSPLREIHEKALASTALHIAKRSLL